MHRTSPALLRTCSLGDEDDDDNDADNGDGGGDEDGDDDDEEHSIPNHPGRKC